MNLGYKTVWMCANPQHMGHYFPVIGLKTSGIIYV